MTTLATPAHRCAGVHPGMVIAPLVVVGIACLLVAAVQVASSPGQVLLVAAVITAGGLLVRVLVASPRLLLGGVLVALSMVWPWFLLGIVALLLRGDRG